MEPRRGGGIMGGMASIGTSIAASAESENKSPTHPPLRRYPDRGMLGGVCEGLAARFGGVPLLFRLGFALFLFVGGVGVAMYALAWALIRVAPDSEGVPRRRGAWRDAVLIVVGLAGAVIALRLLGVGDVLFFVWPLVLGACALAIFWRPAVDPQAPVQRRARLRDYARGSAPIDAPRLILGGLLFVFALASLLHSFEVLHSLKQSIWAVAIVATMLGVLTGPWFVRLGRSLASERAARIREQERAEVAAHLHDSVLQTLALIQTRSGDAREVATLARRQERELRRWLFDLPGGAGGHSVRALLERAAAEVEELHAVPVEAVVVGDAAPDAQLEALVLAAREAMTNAAKFSGADRVDLYAEIEPDRVELFVRDRGVGFDCAQIPPDRHGVRDSIIERMRRHGGAATVRSEAGQGTEVELVLARVHRDRGQVAMRPIAPS
jgi:signal transduction histidine kinase